MPLTAGTLLVAGHQQRKAPAEIMAAAADEAQRRGEHGGEAALHVDGAAAVENAVDYRPRRMAGERQRASGPGGTTSAWPASVKCRVPSPIAAKRFSTDAEPSSWNTGRSTENPARAR